VSENLTIVVVDTAYHELTKLAIEQTLSVVSPKEILVFSDKNIYPGSRWINIDPINQIEYSRFVLKEIGNHIETDHFMCIQYDGMPINNLFWDDSYLNYDYIGAPWSWGPLNRRVGNGGFSIRSKKLALECQNSAIIFNPNNDNNYMEDLHICVMYAEYLESKGIKFAPINLASKFSAENPGGKFDTYGFHGTLCLPYYLNDEHMEKYIINMNRHQFGSDIHRRIIFGLCMAERWDHMELMMDRGIEFFSDFKDQILVQLDRDFDFIKNLSRKELEYILANYK